MKPQSKPKAVALIGDTVQSRPLTPAQYDQISPGFWAVLARIQARMDREQQTMAPAQAS